MRLQPSGLSQLDTWIADQEDKPSRPEAIPPPHHRDAANSGQGSRRKAHAGEKAKVMNDRTIPTYFHRWSPPPSPSTERLRAAILLGQQMAEQEAMAMLTAKARQVLPDDRKHEAEEAIRRLVERVRGT